ncbi:hypothetical protein P3655_17545 [Vibrio parahaemolyticus]|uniref:hypothetical protein n=1 Tax=Vibrio parahaemolyticus TaxID=670 RepID=UPI001FAD0A85|nr:hypothetical protein [Vibrio parahaemolyticus]MCR9663717.1 hypothetical protein [Vibrio parahaemolyticus]MCR9677316.1 hypothetical protein [Vibrio parahaemolyticus]MDF4637447.1 hypothetical protein [Vibrio parahaemolyticus]MDF5190007.1 hypothetical protein [Vibrio parahaemolyticus]MDF5226827.1 hypothetical protein [Vibrio parahaemolyticus]
MINLKRRKYVYNNPGLKVIKKPLNDDLNLVEDLRGENVLISDSDALQKANSLTVEEQRHIFKSRSSNPSNYFSGHRSFGQRNARTNEYQSTFPKQTDKESRVPGLFGCNRYKSKRIQQVKDTESFSFF